MGDDRQPAPFADSLRKTLRISQTGILPLPLRACFLASSSSACHRDQCAHRAPGDFGAVASSDLNRSDHCWSKASVEHVWA
jgi:hypothetical protein